MLFRKINEPYFIDIVLSVTSLLSILAFATVCFNMKVLCCFCSPLNVLLTTIECYSFMKVLHVLGKFK